MPTRLSIAQLIQAEQRLQRGFLHDVFETVVRAKQSLAYAAHQRQVAGKQVRKSLLVACPSTLNQRRVVVCHDLPVPRDSATWTRLGYPKPEKFSAASGDAAAVAAAIVAAAAEAPAVPGKEQ